MKGTLAVNSATITIKTLGIYLTLVESRVNSEHPMKLFRDIFES